MKTQTIRPIQPYFVLNTATPYLKKSMETGEIAHFYSFTASCKTETILGVPDACTDIIFSLGSDGPAAEIHGCNKKPVPTNFREGAQYFGVRYKVGSIPPIPGILPRDLVDRGIPLSEICSFGQELAERIQTAQSFDERIRIFTGFFPTTERQQPAEPCLSLSRLLIAKRGNIRIRDLAGYTRYSIRSVNNAFADFYGISPKTLCLILRYQDALIRMTHNTSGSLADLAYELGYADQSHFLSEFKRYNLLGPRKFLKELASCGYQNTISYT